MKKVLITENYRVDKNNKVYDCYGNWIGMLYKNTMSKEDCEEFWGESPARFDAEILDKRNKLLNKSLDNIFK